MSKASLSALKCIACDALADPRGARFTCASCGDLLAVEHDFDSIKQRFGDLRATFDGRLGQMTGAYASGVWRYHELILPELPLDEAVTLPEGNTPLYRRQAIARFVGAATVYVKHEGENPTLSFKDRGMTAGVSWARHVGAAKVACASTGDTSAAMAAYAAAAGIPGVVLLPLDKVSVEQLAQPICYGARVLALKTDFDGCMRVVKQLTESGDIYLLNSMNPFRIEGQKAIGIEAIHQLGWKVPDWFVIPVGNAGNISALGKGLLALYQLGIIDRLPRIAGVQAKAAAPFYRAFKGSFSERVRLVAEPTVASAIRIGDPVSYDKARAAVQRLDGVVTEVSDEEAMAAKAECDAAGVHICPNSGVAVAGARRLRREGTISAGDSVVVIATAHGAKFSSAAIEHHTATVPANAPGRRNPPRPIDPTVEAVREAIVAPVSVDR